MKNIILVKNMKDKESAESIRRALSETRVDFSVDEAKQCVIIDGNSDMVAIARKVINDCGFMII